MNDKIKELIDELKQLEDALEALNIRKNKMCSYIETLEQEIFKLVDEKKNETNYQVWKEMEGNYYHVMLYTVPDDERFVRCQYVHVLKVERDFLQYEYINVDNKSKNCNYITITTFDFCHERGYREWTEIHKNEYERIIKTTPHLERLEARKTGEV